MTAPVTYHKRGLESVDPKGRRALVRVEAMTWERGECPLCAQGVPLHAPGSRHLIDGSDRGR